MGFNSGFKGLMLLPA